MGGQSKTTTERGACELMEALERNRQRIRTKWKKRMRYPKPAFWTPARTGSTGNFATEFRPVERFPSSITACDSMQDREPEVVVLDNARQIQGYSRSGAWTLHRLVGSVRSRSLYADAILHHRRHDVTTDTSCMSRRDGRDLSFPMVGRTVWADSVLYCAGIRTKRCAYRWLK